MKVLNIGFSSSNQLIRSLVVLFVYKKSILSKPRLVYDFYVQQHHFVEAFEQLKYDELLGLKDILVLFKLLLLVMKVTTVGIMAASVIAIFSNSSDESVGSPPSWLILFGDIPTVIPSTFVVAPETYTIAPVLNWF
ncbi:hypothetical protein Tco_0842861 [Tanacetum coccineum]|uniref:Uncharacterized protein n=1 Tax=Tanacetum coccineum TaxID=301880 RepID=A0ABQ5B4T5_9ASTR